jgi:hypothetical protein
MTSWLLLRRSSGVSIPQSRRRAAVHVPHATKNMPHESEKRNTTITVMWSRSHRPYQQSILVLPVRGYG